MKMCWVSITVLLGFVEHVITSQVGNSTLNMSSSDIAQSLTSFAVSTTLYGIMNVNNYNTQTLASTSKYVYNNGSDKLAVKSILLTVSGTSSKKVILTTSEFTSSISFIGRTSHPAISSNVIAISPTVILMPMRSSTSGSITRTQSNLAISSGLKSSSQQIKVGQNKTSINSIIGTSPCLAPSHDLSNTKGEIHTIATTTLVQSTSSLNTKNIDVTQIVTPLPSTAGVLEQTPSAYSKTRDVKEITSSIKHISSKHSPITIFTSIMVSESVVAINHTIKESAKTAYVSSTAMRSGTSTFLTSSIKDLQSSKSLSATNSFEKSLPAMVSEIISTSSSMLTMKSSLVAMTTSFPIVNVTHASDTETFESIPSSRYFSLSRSSAAVDFASITSIIVAVAVESVSSILVLSSMSSNINSTSSYFSKKKQPVISFDVKSSSTSTLVSLKLSSLALSSSMAELISSSMLTSSFADVSPITSSLSMSTPLLDSPIKTAQISLYWITIGITPSSSIQHWPKTKVVLPHFTPASGKVQFTLAGRVGIGVAIAAGIIIIILLIYFAKSKRKINRYRRYDNTYQIPGFTDIGGMVQLSTIGDSEYEILDATDYTRGDNPLYDLTQNSGPEISYDNNGHAKNGYGENIATTNTNATNLTNFSTFK